MRLFGDVDGTSHRPEGNRLKKHPTLVLLHGGPGHDHSAFKPEFQRLARDMQIVFVDHRGMVEAIAPPIGMRAIAEAIGANATLARIEDAAHIVWADQPDCIELIGNWLHDE